MARERTVLTLRRVLRLAFELAERGTEGASAKELMRELGAKRATFYRDLKTLADAGLPPERFEHQGGARIRLVLGHRLPAPGTTLRERLALLLVRKALPGFEGSFVTEVLDSLLERSAEVRQIKGPRKVSPLSAPLDTIARAIRQKRCMQFRYQGANEAAPTLRVVEPIELRLVGEQVYLIAWDLDRDEPRTFKPLRMSHVFARPEAAKRRTVDVDALLSRSVRVWSGQPIDVRVRIRGVKARFLAEWPLHRDQRLERTESGEVIVSATVAGLMEAARWVLRWGKDAVVLEPMELRDWVVAELEGALREYRGEKMGRRSETVSRGS